LPPRDQTGSVRPSVETRSCAAARASAMPRDLERFLHRQRPPGQPLGKRLAFDELQDQRLDAARLLEAIDRSNVRMVQSGQDLSLAPEPRQPLGIRCERLRQHLDGHVAIELAVPRAVHLSHPASPERGEDLVGAQARAR
jgi:hypothetical protein